MNATPIKFRPIPKAGTHTFHPAELRYYVTLARRHSCEEPWVNYKTSAKVR